MAAPVRRFWDPVETASTAIITVDEYSNPQSDQYTMEASVWHVWEHIPRPYFPDRAPAVGADHYAIEREAYRGPPAAASIHKPDVIVVRLRAPPAPVVPPVPGQRPQRAQERDILWIECKAPSEGAPNGWNSVMTEAVARLSSAHPTREVYLILAIGIKWMCFLWDPVNPLPMGSELHIISAGQTVWAVDARVKPIPNLAGQRHIGNSFLVDTTQAYSLDYWSVKLVQNVVVQANLADLQLLENVFALIQAQNFNGWNPAHF